MLRLTELASAEQGADDALTLDFDARQKSRLLACTDKGVQVGLFLPRGTVMRAGTLLTGSAGFKVRVNAAPETLSIVRTDDPLLFARACYHLGNRHIALQILPGELRYLKDHVLDQMLTGLGLTVEHEVLAFEPEAGAYHSHGH